MYARAHWRARVEWILGLPLGFLNGVKPQVTQEATGRATQGPVWGTE
jgi:hypothetical protein